MRQSMVHFPWFDDPVWQEHAARVHDDIGGDPVFTYQSSHDPWFTSSYYFETERGVVVFDTQLCRSSAMELWDQIQETTSGNVLCIINSHAHPDHFWGNTYFREVAPQAMIITSENVLADLQATARARIAVVPESWGDEAIQDPDDLVLPDAAFDQRMRLSFEGITLELWECGPAECPVQLVGWIPEHRLLLAGDVVQNRLTYYASERAFGSWYRILEELKELKPHKVLTGHLGVAEPQILDESLQWFSTLIGLTAQELPPGSDPQDFERLDDGARARIVEAMRAAFPEWWDAMMLEPGESCLEFALRGQRSEGVGQERIDAGIRLADHA